jgi:hypothetical protein
MEYLESLEAEDLSLKGAEEPPEPKDRGARTEAALEATEEPDESEGEPPAEEEGESGPAARPRRVVAPEPPIGTRATGGAGRQQTEAVEPPGTLIGLAKAVANDPGQALGIFRKGVRDPVFVGSLAGTFAILACATGLSEGLCQPKQPGTSRAMAMVGRAIALFLDLGIATCFLWLLSMAVKRDRLERPAPIGIAEGLAFARMAALVVIAPIAVVLGALVVSGGGTENAPGAVVWLGQHLWIGYVGLVFAGQLALLMPLLDLGCAVGAVLSLAMAYGGRALGLRLVGLL